MRFDWVLGYDKHIGEKLIAIRIEMGRTTFQPFCSMLGMHTVFNIVVMQRGKPSLQFSRGLVLTAKLLFPTKCNTKTALQTNHLCFLLHPDLYSTCNYQSPHNLVLGTSIKTCLGNLGDVTLLILGTSIKACLGNLGDVTLLILGTSIKARLGNLGDVTLLILGTSIKPRLGNLGDVTLLILGTSIKPCLGNLGEVTHLILGTSIKACLGNLGDVTLLI